MIDLQKLQAALAEIHACDEKIADRIPIKMLPRPPEEIPNVEKLRACIQELQTTILRVRRKTTTAKGHDLEPQPDGSLGAVAGRDLAAVGIVEEIRTIAKGQDRALPNATTLVRVAFPAGEHVYFEPADLKPVAPDVKDKPKP